MSRALRALGAPETDATASAMRALAVALAPHLRELLAAERLEGELVDVVATVPGPRRSIMKAARSGKIRGAVRVGRRWLAPREALTEWLTSVGPRALPAAKSDDDGDELEPLRRRLLAGGRR